MKQYQASYEHPQGNNGKSQNNNNNKSTKIVLITVMSLILLTTVPFYYPNSSASSLASYTSLLGQSSSDDSDSDSDSAAEIPSSSTHKCDIFTGEWVPNPKAPYYTNTTCWAIHEHQNCMKYGRPDTAFIKWRWKPDGCDLPVFNPAQFLELVRDKSLAFVGDSVARNQMQSLICLLSRIEYPIDVSYTKDEHWKRWKYTSYNFTMASFWTPHLVKGIESDPNGPSKTGLFSLYVDEFDETWTDQIAGFDHLIISAGHWFYRSMVFHERRRVIGCHYCLLPNVPDLGMFFGYRRALRTALRAVTAARGYHGVTYLRTFAPSHFENGPWNAGGNCVRTRPFRSSETALEGPNLEMYMTQIEEFRAAERAARRKGLRFRLLDMTQAMLLRPDGHPSRFGHWPHENVTLYNDCVHWCLPGPIDTWNDFLLEMIKTERIRAADERRLFGRS